MKLDRIIFFTLFLIVISADSVCMDKSIISYTQRTVTIPCSDGTYELAKWKVFESITLHEHCLKHDKNFESACGVIEVPLFPNVCVEEMALFSQALDVMPGALLHEHIMQKLTTEQRKKLITAAGRQDEKRIVKLNAPAFTGNLVDAFFEKDFIKEHIKSRLQRAGWFNYCLNKCVRNNLKKSLYADRLFFETTHSINNEKGYIYKVSQYLNKDSLYSGARMCCRGKDNDFIYYANKYLDQSWQHYMTSIDSSGGDAKNKRLLWSINKDKNIINKIVIGHKQDIWSSDFSNNGEFLLVRSANELSLAKIIHNQDGTSSFEIQKIDYYASQGNNHKIIRDIYFNPQATHFIVLFGGDNDGCVDVWDISGKFITTIHKNYVGCPLRAVWDRDGNRLLVCSSMGNKQLLLVIWDMNDLLDIHCLQDWVVKGNNVNNVICSPDGRHWAAVVDSDRIIYINTAKKAWKLSAFTELSALNQKKINILFSFDSRFLIAAIPQELSFSPNVKVWSTFTGDNIVCVHFPGVQTHDWGIGIIPYNREIVFVDNDLDRGKSIAFKRPFTNVDDTLILSWLHKSTSVHELNLLRRLCLAQEDHVVVELYEEEPAYKALMGMQSKTLDVAGFVKKYLSWNVINNKKYVIALAQEATKEVVQRMQEAWQKFLF